MFLLKILKYSYFFSMMNCDQRFRKISSFNHRMIFFFFSTINSFSLNDLTTYFGEWDVLSNSKILQTFEMHRQTTGKIVSSLWSNELDYNPSKKKDIKDILAHYEYQVNEEENTISIFEYNSDQIIDQLVVNEDGKSAIGSKISIVIDTKGEFDVELLESKQQFHVRKAIYTRLDPSTKKADSNAVPNQTNNTNDELLNKIIQFFNKYSAFFYLGFVAILFQLFFLFMYRMIRSLCSASKENNSKVESSKESQTKSTKQPSSTKSQPNNNNNIKQPSTKSNEKKHNE